MSQVTAEELEAKSPLFSKGLNPPHPFPRQTIAVTTVATVTMKGVRHFLDKIILGIPGFFIDRKLDRRGHTPTTGFFKQKRAIVF